MELYYTTDASQMQIQSPEECEKKVLHYKNVRYAIEVKNPDLVRKVLQSVGDDKEVIIKQKPLHLAAECGAVEIAGILLDWGLDMNTKGESYTLPLHVAIKHDKYDIFTFLLSRGADVHARGYGDKGAIHVAAKNSDTRYLQDVLLKGASVDMLDGDGQTALHVAAYYNDKPNMKILLNKGIDKATQDIYKKTALDYNKKHWTDPESIVLLQV